MLLPEIKSNVTPAQVQWPKAEIAEFLDKMLVQYKDVVVSAETVKDDKKLVADLRKRKTEVDDFRKKTKKELTEEVSLFEADVKDLLKQFDNVINPIDEQIKQLDQMEKDKKRNKIDEFIIKYTNREGLAPGYGIEFDNKWLNKSATLKSIEQEIEEIAIANGKRMDEIESNKTAITESVRMQNEAFGLTLVASTYIEMLDHFTLAEILVRINKDVIEAQKINTPEPTIEKEPTVEITGEPDPIILNEGEVWTEEWLLTGTEQQLKVIEETCKRIGVKYVIHDEEEEDE